MMLSSLKADTTEQTEWQGGGVGGTSWCAHEETETV